jgi:hypothetical protein
MLVDQENNIILMCRVITDWETNLRGLIHSMVEKFSLSYKYLILVDFVPAADGTDRWRVAQISSVQGQFLRPSWQEVSEDDINRLLWMGNTAEGAAEPPPFPVHGLAELLRSGREK